MGRFPEVKVSRNGLMQEILQASCCEVNPGQLCKSCALCSLSPSLSLLLLALLCRPREEEGRVLIPQGILKGLCLKHLTLHSAFLAGGIWLPPG